MYLYIKLVLHTRFLKTQKSGAVMMIANDSSDIKSVDIGRPSSRNTPSESWKAVKLDFHKPRAVLYAPGTHVLSPKFFLYEHEWSLKLSLAEPRTLTAYLNHYSEGNIEVNFRILFLEHSIKKQGRNDLEPWRRCFFSGRQSKRYGNLGYLASENPDLLSVCLLMISKNQHSEEEVTRFIPKSFIPKNSFAEKLSNLITDENLVDVLFVVQNEKHSKESYEEVEHKESASDSDNEVTLLPQSSVRDVDNDENLVYAHRLILQACAPGLAALCEPYENLIPVPIDGVDVEVFKLALKYVYGLDIERNEWKLHCQKLLDVADKYELIDLKLMAEAACVEFMAITADNAHDLLLYADAKNCPLLKEAVMKFFVNNKAEALRIVSSNILPKSGSLLTDLLAVMTAEDQKYDQNEGKFDDSIKYKMMDVSSLRREASERGLDIDGSRETLIASLENESGKKRKREETE